jgi:tetratricopeptide (TPR) repeat protein
MLAINLQLSNLDLVEKNIKNIFISSFEKRNIRSRDVQIKSLGEFLEANENKAHIEIYQNFCLLWSFGLKDKKDLKKIIEMIIYFDEFKFQVMILALIDRLGIEEVAREFAVSVKSNKEYQYPYFDKYFKNLKKYFYQKPNVNEEVSSLSQNFESIEVSKKYTNQIQFSEIDFEEEHDENYGILKHGEFGFNDVCELATAYIQSDLPRGVVKASQEAIRISVTDAEYLKASYLKLTGLMLSKDYRAAIDVCYEALEKANSENDILSFLYSKAEAHLKLGERKVAQEILVKILKINGQYRMAKERLNTLNEV